jgi:hypothetical protein
MQYNFMFVFKNYDRQNHVLSFMTKLISDFYVILRVEVRCTRYNIMWSSFACNLWQVGGFFPGTPVSSTNITDRYDIGEILLKVALNTITLTR